MDITYRFPVKPNPTVVTLLLMIAVGLVAAIPDDFATVYEELL